MKTTLLLTLVVLPCSLALAEDQSQGASSSATSSSRPRAAADAQSTEQKFIVRASSAGMAEVQMGQLAVKKGTSPKVKELGKMMIDDHSKANSELATVASNAGYTLSKDLEADHTKGTQKLVDADAGNEFDKKFVKAMVKSHKMTIEEFEAAQKDAKDPAVKAFIDKNLPTLRAHLSHAEQLQEEMKQN